jgi:hypothetical protein
MDPDVPCTNTHTAAGSLLKPMQIIIILVITRDAKTPGDKLLYGGA